MTALWTAAEAAAATGGQAQGDWSVTGLSIDSRSIEPGEMFVALKDVRDGHDFVADALAKGAGAALVSRVPDGVGADAPLLIVDDVVPGLKALAQAARARTQAKVIGVTGSVGKTTTKEMLRTILSRQGKVHAAEKSFNNHWGVPLTLARMPADTDYAVIEIGMSNPGEIAPLARLAQLDVAMVTIVAPAHLEAFGQIEGIAHEKASIIEGLRPDGVAVLNADVETAGILFQKAAKAGAKAVAFGHGPDCRYRMEEARLHQEQTIVQASVGGQNLLFKLQTPGKHFAMNGLAALAAAEAAGADLGRAAVDLGQWTPYGGRGARTRIQLDPAFEDQFVDLIDDSYNANPASVGAALDMLAATKPEDGVGRIAAGRRIAVLGDMLELGAEEKAMHAALAQHPAMSAVDRVHCVGARAKALYEALPPEKRGHWTQTSDELAAEAPRMIDAGDVILVKGSAGILLKRVVDALLKLGKAVGNER